MEYKRLGKAGLKVSELSYGAWITFATQVGIHEAKKLIRYAFDHGVNFFDNAEAYEQGAAEEVMAEAIKDFRREDLVISTKLFWGGDGPNDRGLSRKHLIEGIYNSLGRLQLDYVDLVFCHRPDPETPIAETVLAMDFIIRNGLAFYWGTSEWSAAEIEEAYRLADELGAIPPTMEQPKYNLFFRERFEIEYAPLFEKHQLGTTIWSPLASGWLTGKYNNGVPKGSRLDIAGWQLPDDFPDKVEKIKLLKNLADQIGCSLSQFSLAWCLKNQNVSTVITGASKLEQLQENLQAIKFKDQLTDDVMREIDAIMAD